MVLWLMPVRIPTTRAERRRSAIASRSQPETSPATSSSSCWVSDPWPNEGTSLTDVIVTWTVWRGPGNVTFAPALQRVVKSGDAVVTATFEKPGTYQLRAKANDTHRFVEKDVTVTVTVTAQ